MLKFKKLSQFSSSVILEAIWGSLPRANVEKVVDEAYENTDSIYFARVIDDYCDMGSLEALNISTFNERGVDQCDVYISPRRNSIFHGSIDHIQTLLSEGYALYRIDEYEHGGIALRLMHDKPITKKDFRSGEAFHRSGLQCRFDSSLAFFAQSLKNINVLKTVLPDFENWINGQAYAFQVIEATFSKDKEGNTKYDCTVLDSCGGFLDEQNALECAEQSLVWFMERAEQSISNK